MGAAVVRWASLVGPVAAVLVVLAGHRLVTATPAQAPSFAGETLRIVVGSSAGGGLDVEARLLARHLGRHLPGVPRVVVEAIPGAAGVIAANRLARVTKPDGLTMGFFTLGPVVAQLAGSPGVAYDVRRFEAVGAGGADSTVCFARRAARVRSVSDWQARTEPLRFASTGLGSITHAFPALLAEHAGLPIRVVSGYRGTNEMRLAFATGEVDAVCLSWTGIKAGWPDRSDVVLLVQAGRAVDPELAHVPRAVSLATTALGREVFGAPLDAMAVAGRFFALSPGTPRAIRDTLRRAFADTLRDPRYLVDAGSAGLLTGAAPLTGDDVAASIAVLFRAQPLLLPVLRAPGAS